MYSEDNPDFSFNNGSNSIIKQEKNGFLPGTWSCFCNEVTLQFWEIITSDESHARSSVLLVHNGLNVISYLLSFSI